ncbi:MULTISPECIES: hypothetical protein [Bacillaceae]|uniref:Uncharacterized protein n=1 Tax=Evansella alkalicola TaxID=745819 RepID=A0ABS6JS07_9BACI|nr:MULTISPECIES: hypothetical protein [Bacillaceae]MBU9721352.1 hypothetical protein [Bacillus alkalicola]
MQYNKQQIEAAKQEAEAFDKAIDFRHSGNRILATLLVFAFISTIILGMLGLDAIEIISALILIYFGFGLGQVHTAITERRDLDGIYI